MRDFIIIGGGIAGVSAAAQLAKLGSVTLLEAESSLGYHASGRSAALYEANYGTGSTIALSKASLAYHQAENVLSMRGFMLVAMAGDPRFETDRAALKCNTISPAEARDLMPILNDDVVHAAYNETCWDIDTDLLLQGFHRQARAGGAVFETKAKAARISRIAQGWEVEAGGATYHAKTLINAAGAWADQVATLAGIAPIGLTPLRRSMARIAAPEGRDLSRWPMVMGAGETWYCKPDAGALIVSPADEDPCPPHDAWPEDMVLAEGLARYEAHVTVPVTRPISSWAGLRSFAPDRQFVLGPAPQDASFFWCAGQGGYGMQSAPAAAQLLADLIAGRPPEIGEDAIRAVSPARFAP